nr:putative RNA-directed DNA polymerase [Tanacetum cinerariifolium]
MGDMFALVAKINTIRILISIASNQDWPLKQFDVKNAFLNGDLEEEVYMNPPPDVKCSGKVCRLKKALYGLKKSPYAWFERVLSFMKKIRKNQDHQVCGYTDVDWAGDRTNGKSTSGYFTFVGGNLVTWKSKKQKVVSRLSAEAKFQGMLHCDNQAAVKIANNPVQYDKTKHIEIDRHFIKDHLKKKTVELLHKYNADGSLSRYKSRLMANGHSQQ